MPREQCGVPECRPGTEVSLRALWTGNDLTGRLTFDGRTYNDLGGLNSFAQASIELLGFFTAPPMADAAEVMAPFRLVGMFDVPNDAGTASVRHTLSGAGTAIIDLSRAGNAPADDPAWAVDSVRYQFAAAEPVPEPGTMLLVGLGIAGLARRAQQRRARD
jgi:hypothetical protein